MNVNLIALSKLLTLVFFCLGILNVSGQVKVDSTKKAGVGLGLNENVDPSASFEVRANINGSIGGLLLPTVEGLNEVETPIAPGLLVYNIPTQQVCYYNTAWVCLDEPGSGGGSQTISRLGSDGTTLELSNNGGTLNNALVPTNGGTGHVLTKTSNGYSWQAVSFIEADGDITNEGLLSVQQGGSNSSVIQSNTSNSSVTIQGSGAVQVSEVGNAIIVNVPTVGDPWLLEGNSYTGDKKLGSLTPNSEISVVTNDIERMRVKSDGKIGAGIANPEVKLHVKDPSNQVAKFEGGINSEILIGKTALSGHSNTLYENSAGQLWVGMDANGKAAMTSNLPSTGISLATQGTEKVRILNDGKVGIGTGNPEAKLDVNGEVIVRERSGTPSKVATFNADGKLVEGPTINSNGEIGSQFWLDNSQNVPNSITTTRKVNIGQNGENPYLILSDLNVDDADSNGQNIVSIYKGDTGTSSKSGLIINGGGNITSEIFHYGTSSNQYSIGIPLSNRLQIKGNTVLTGQVEMGSGNNRSIKILGDSIRIYKPLKDASGDFGNASKVLSATTDGSLNWVDATSVGNTTVISTTGTNIAVTGAGTSANPFIINNTYVDADSIAGNEVLNATTNGGLVRTGLGTAASPFTLGLPAATTGQVMTYNGTAWVAGNETDGSTTNEIQTLSITGNILSLNNGGGSVTLPNATEVDGVIGNEVNNATINGGLVRTGTGTAASPYTLGLPAATTDQVMKYNGTAWVAGTDNGITFEVDGVIGNEGQLTVSGTTPTRTITSNSGSFVNVTGSGIVNVAGTGTEILISATEIDGVIGNEVNNATTNGGLVRAGSGTNASPYTLGLPAATTGQVMTYNGTSWVAGNEADGSTTNEIQTLSIAGNVISLTSGGSVTLPSGGGATDLSVTGTTSPFTLNSSTGTDVTFTAGTNVTLSGSANNLTINSPSELPSQANNSGKFLTTNGTSPTWATVPVLPASVNNNTLRGNSTTGWVASSFLQNSGTKVTIDDNGTTTNTSLPTTKLHVDGVVQIGKNNTQASTLIGTDLDNAIVNVPVNTAGLYVTNGSLSNAFGQLSTSSSSAGASPLSMNLTTTASKMLIPAYTTNGAVTLVTGTITLPSTSQLLGRYKLSYSFCISTPTNALYEASIFSGSTELANTRIRKTMTGDECFSKDVIHDFGTTAPALELRLKSSTSVSVSIYSPAFSVQFMAPGAP